MTFLLLYEVFVTTSVVVTKPPAFWLSESEEIGQHFKAEVSQFSKFWLGGKRVACQSINTLRWVNMSRSLSMRQRFVSNRFPQSAEEQNYPIPLWNDFLRPTELFRVLIEHILLIEMHSGCSLRAFFIIAWGESVFRVFQSFKVNITNTVKE